METKQTKNPASLTKKPKAIPVHQQDADQIRATIAEWNLSRMRRAVEQFADWDMTTIDGTLRSRVEPDKMYFAEQSVPVRGFGIIVHVGCDCEDQKQHINRLQRRADELGLAETEPVHCKHYYIRLLLDGMALSYCGARIQIPEARRRRHLK